MKHTRRDRRTNFLEREEVTFDPQASPSFFPPQHTRCSVRWERLLSYHGSGSTVPVCARTPTGENQKGREANARDGNVRSVLLTT